MEDIEGLGDMELDRLNCDTDEALVAVGFAIGSDRILRSCRDFTDEEGLGCPRTQEYDSWFDLDPFFRH